MLRAERISRESSTGALRSATSLATCSRAKVIARFTIERVADEAGYARTGIYRFFSAKSDLLSALAVESARASCRALSPRRRVRGTAAGAFRGLRRSDLSALSRHVLPQVFGSPTLTAPSRGALDSTGLRALEREDEALVLGVASDARRRRRPRSRVRMTLEETLFGLHALTSGIFERMGSCRRRPESGMRGRCCASPASRLLDGLGWRPLTSEWDYRATMARIYDEILTPRLLASLGLHEDPVARRPALGERRWLSRATREPTPRRSSPHCSARCGRGFTRRARSRGFASCPRRLAGELVARPRARRRRALPSSCGERRPAIARRFGPSKEDEARSRRWRATRAFPAAMSCTCSTPATGWGPDT
jgi:AcrR family transcriptional regulator